MTPVEISRPTEKTVRLRFVENVCYAGVNFGPQYDQREAEVREDWAKHFLRRKVAVLAPVPAVGIEEADPESEVDPDVIPAGFPGQKALAVASITRFDELLAVEDLTKISGIGAKTAQEIDELLAEIFDLEDPNTDLDEELDEALDDPPGDEEG